jgi:hypothetical protein
MNNKTKNAIIASSAIALIATSSFTTIKFREWFPRKTEIKIVFENSRFSQMPELKPLKDKTTYKFIDCDFTGRQFGEYITPQEVENSLDKLEMKKKGGR